MPPRIAQPELFGITESSLTLSFRVEDDAGPVDAPAAVRVGGEIRAVSEGVSGTRLVRVEGLESACEYRLEIEVAGAAPPERDARFPETVTTHAAPRARAVGSFATLNDLHFGESRFGGTTADGHDFGEEAPGFPVARASDTEIPYWKFMNDDAIAAINGLDVDMTLIKGDIADRGEPDQFEAAADAFSRFARPHHAFLGNHDYYARQRGQEVDGYAILRQPRAPRVLDFEGWRLLLLETAEPGDHHGVFDGDRLSWLGEQLDETRDLGRPTLLLMHHQPVPPEHRDQYPNTIGLLPEHSLPLFDLLGLHRQVRGVLIGHTHRNRVRHYSASGGTPFIEVNCTKDYPGGFGHYRLFEDGSFRQEVRRTPSERALAHSTRCRGFFRGFYRDFALGSLAERSLCVEAE